MMKYDVYAALMNVPSPETVNDGVRFICPAGFIHLASGIKLDSSGMYGFCPYLILTGRGSRKVAGALHESLPIQLLLVGDGSGIYEGVTQAIYLPQAVLVSDGRFDPVYVIGRRDSEINAARRDYWFGPNIGKFTEEMGWKRPANADLWRS